MEGEEVIKSLPEELVEKIVAMIPFPSIFSARLLSKTWLAKFEPISSINDEEKKHHARSFQRQVAQWSNTWDTFCPVCLTEEYMIAYNQATRKWRQLPSLSFLPTMLFLAGLNLQDPFLYMAKEFLYTEGALLYGTWSTAIQGVPADELYVANIFTRKSKCLPPRPEADLTIVHCINLIIDASLASYKVILFCQVGQVGDHRTHQRNCHFAQIYNSKSGTWSSKKFVLSNDFSTSLVELYSSCAHLNGVLYMVGRWKPQSLLAFNVEEGSLKEVRLAFNDVPLTDTFKLVICNATLVMIRMDLGWSVRILKIDLESLLLREVTGSPFSFPPVGQDMAPCLTYVPAAIEVNCTFFDLDTHRRYFGWMVTYNQHNDEWNVYECSKRDHQWSDCSFRPGLNPFIEV